MARGTKRLRIAVGIDEYGNWQATGWGRGDDDGTPGLDDAWHRRAVSDGLEGNARFVWVEVTVPLPAHSRPIVRGAEVGEIVDPPVR